MPEAPPVTAAILPFSCPIYVFPCLERVPMRDGRGTRCCPAHLSRMPPYSCGLLACERKAHPKTDEQRPTHPVQPATDRGLEEKLSRLINHYLPWGANTGPRQRRDRVGPDVGPCRRCPAHTPRGWRVGARCPTGREEGGGAWRRTGPAGLLGMGTKTGSRLGAPCRRSPPHDRSQEHTPTPRAPPPLQHLVE